MRIENMSSFLDFISKIGRLKHDLSRTYYRSRKNLYAIKRSAIPRAIENMQGLNYMSISALLAF